MIIYLFLESEDALDEFLHSVFLLLWIYDRSVLACSRLVALFLGYASATAVAAWANIVLVAWALLVAVIAVIAALLAVAVLWLLAWLGWQEACDRVFSARARYDRALRDMRAAQDALEIFRGEGRHVA